MYVFIGENDDCNFFMALSIKRETFLIDVFKKCYLSSIQREAKNTSFQLFVQQSDENTRVIPKSTSDWLVKINALS